MWPFRHRHRGKIQFVKVPLRLQGKYDAAQTTPENRNHWSAADGLSADSANGRAVRETLRRRARYEVANNSYAKGIVLTLANYCVGTGPRLQLVTEDPGLNRELEQGFADWSGAVNLAGKLRTMRMAKATDGEAFALMASSDRHSDSMRGRKLTGPPSREGHAS